MDDMPPIKKNESNEYVVRLDRECPTCLKTISVYYSRELLSSSAGNTPIIECSTCKTTF